VSLDKSLVLSPVVQRASFAYLLNIRAVFILVSCVEDCMFTELSSDLSPPVPITLEKIVAGSF